MNAILSLFLSLAMLFSGGALPAALDTASTLTVQDVVIGYNGENYSLGFDFSVSAAASQDELLLHFEAEDAEGLTLLPVTGKITRDDATFAISNEGSAFTVTAETLNQMLGLEEGDISSIEGLIGGLEGYFSALSALKQKQAASVSPETEAAMMDVLYANMQDMVKEEVEWDFGSGEIPAIRVNGKISGAGLFSVLDGWLALDDDTIAPALSGVLDLYNSIFGLAYAYAVPGEVTVYADKDETIGVIGGADGPTAVYVAGEEAAEYVPAESFTQLLNTIAAGDEEALAELEQVSAEMDILSGAEDETRYQIVNLYAVLDEELGAVMNINTETATSVEETDSYFGIYMEEGSSIISCEVQTNVEGPLENPLAMNVEAVIQTDEAEDYTDYEAEEIEEDILYSTNAVFISAGTVFADGLEDADVYMEMNQSSTRYVDGEVAEEEDPENVSLTYFVDEELDEEGKLLRVFDINLSANDEESISLSFNTVSSQGPVQDYFAGRDIVELPADGEDPAYEILSGNAMSLMGDMIAISSNDDFAALTAAFSGTEASYDEDYEEDYEEEYEEDYEEDYDYEEDDSAEADGEYSDEEYEFASLEDAAEVFAGELISYTAPEGFETESVYVTGDGSFVNANYVSEDGRYISFNQDYYDPSDGSIDYFTIADGAFAKAEGEIASVYKTEAGYYYAQFYLDDGSLTFYFDDCDEAALQEIMAGLQF